MFGMVKLKMVEIISKSLLLENEEYINQAFKKNKVFLLLYVPLTFPLLNWLQDIIRIIPLKQYAALQYL